MIGHQKQRALLKSIALKGDANHAYLFSGEEQLGKKSIALEFAKMVCPNIAYPDLICIEGGAIKDIRDLIWKLSLKPYAAPFKIAVIDNAHLMNAESQNCFLKTLEEPKGKVLIILVTSYPEMMLETILSRVERVRFFPVETAEMEKHFAKNIVSLSRNRPGRAMELAGNSDKMEECEKTIADLKKMMASDLAVRFQFAKKLLSEEDSATKLKNILESWLDYFRKMLLENISKKEGYPISKIKRIINKIQTIYFLVSTTNVNQKLALEIVMMEF